MRSTIVLLGTLALVACSRERAETGSTTTTGATADAGVSAEQVRLLLIERRPTEKTAVDRIIIANEAGVIVLRGNVDDEATRSDMVNTVKGMPNVKGVRDELQVTPKQQMGQTGQTGQTGQMGQTGQTEQKGKTALDETKGETPAQGASKARSTDAVRAGLTKDKAAPADVLNMLVITHDGSAITVSGTVPDHDTHQKVMKSAKKAAGKETVKDNLSVASP